MRRSRRGFWGRVAERTDAIVESVAPVWGLKRAAARYNTERLKGAHKLSSAYEGAKNNRTWSNRAASSGSADADLDEDSLETLRERARDLRRNDGLVAACIDSLTDNVVGTGFRPVLRLDWKRLGISKERAKALRLQAREIWEEWGRTADSTNRLHMDELQAQVFATAAVGGDAFVQPIMVEDRFVPSPYELKLEVMEGDRCDTPDGLVNDRVRNGVELGARSQPIAYWISQRHPGDDLLPSGGRRGLRRGRRQFRRLKAHAPTGRPNILHVYKQDRPGQSRGQPIIAPVLNTLKDLRDYDEAVVIAAQIGACFGAFIKETDPYAAALAAATPDTKGQADRHEELSPGAIKYLGPNQDVEFGSPSQPHASYENFVIAMKTGIASALGMPYEVATRDFSNTTWSQARSALVEARRMFVCRQRWLVRAFLQPVWRMLLEEAWLKNRFAAGADFLERMFAWTRTVWVPPGWGWVDPKSEGAAWEQQIKLKIATRSDAIASRSGEDLEDVVERLRDEQELLKELEEEAAEEETPAAPSAGGGEDDDDDQVEDADEDQDDEAEEEETADEDQQAGVAAGAEVP